MDSVHVLYIVSLAPWLPAPQCSKHKLLHIIWSLKWVLIYWKMLKLLKCLYKQTNDIIMVIVDVVQRSDILNHLIQLLLFILSHLTSSVTSSSDCWSLVFWARVALRGAETMRTEKCQRQCQLKRCESFKILKQSKYSIYLAWKWLHNHGNQQDDQNIMPFILRNMKWHISLLWLYI